MKFAFLIFLTVLFAQCEPEPTENKPGNNNGHFAIYYGFMDYKKPINTGLSGKYDQTWTDFLQNAELDTNYRLTDKNIVFLDTGYTRISFMINKSDSVRFKEIIKYDPDKGGDGLFIITLNGERLFAGQFMPMGIAAIPEFPHLRYLNYPPDNKEQILELWGQGYKRKNVQKIIEHFSQSGKIKSK